MAGNIEMKTLTIDGVTFELVDETARSKGEGVFVGNYDTVTFAEIKTAHDAGKVCFLNFDGLMIPLLNLSDTDALFVREINSTTDFKVTITSDSGKDFTLVDKNTPIYVAQTLTDDQKAQARTNIGALSTGDVDTVLQQAKDSGRFDGEDGEDGYTPVKGKDYFDGYTPVKGKDYFDGANGKTAYAYAQDGGYTGTEAEFAAKLASDSDSVFVADYYSTKYAEIVTARDAGKLCFAVMGDMPLCSFVGITDTEATFSGVYTPDLGFQLTFGSNGKNDFGLINSNVKPVLYEAQALTDDQKAQARTNIGAAAAADIATTKYASTSTANTSYFKISDFGSWGTGAWYQKGFSMLITSRAGETVWFSLSANDSATTARAFRLMNTYSKIAGVYYSVSENAVYVKAAGWCNNVTAHILSNIGGDYVPTVASVSGLASDAVEVDIIEFGPTSSGLAVGDSSTPLLLGGSATRPTYNGADMALSSDLSGYLPTTGTAARATADANGNNIANTYANKNVGNTFDGEQKMVNSSYAPTMNDIAGGVGCSLKNARACDNQLIVAEVFAPTTAATDSTINMNAVVGEIGFYHGGGGSGGQFTGKTQLARITSAGIYEGSTLLSDKYLAKSGTAAKATADGNGNNIVSTYFPKSGGKFSGPISFDSASLPSKNLAYICGIDAFANGGEMGWQNKAEFLSGYLTTTGTAAKATADGNGNNIASTYLPKNGGTMTGEIAIGQQDGNGIQLGRNGRLNATTSSGSTSATVCGMVDDLFLCGNSAFMLSLRGSSSRPTYNGNSIALTSDLTYAAGGPLIVTVTGDDTSGYTANKTYDEIMAAWDSGRDVIAKLGAKAYRYSYCVRDMAVLFSFFNTGGTDRVNMEYIVENLTIWHASVGFSPTIDRHNFIAELA